MSTTTPHRATGRPSGRRRLYRNPPPPQACCVGRVKAQGLCSRCYRRWIESAPETAAVAPTPEPLTYTATYRGQARPVSLREGLALARRGARLTVSGTLLLEE